MIRKTRSIYSKVLTVFLFCMVCTFLQGQNPKNSSQDLANSYLGISISPTAYQPLNFTQEVGEKHIKSTSPISGKINLHFTKRIKGEYFIKGGIGFSVIPYHFKHIVNDSMDLIFRGLLEDRIQAEGEISNYRNGLYGHQLTYYEYDQISYHFTLSLLKIRDWRRNTRLKFEIGMDGFLIENVDYRVGEIMGFGENFNIDIRTFQFWMDDTSPGKIARFLPSFFASVGLIKSKRRHLFDMSAFVNYVPKLISTGGYEFYHLNAENRGTLKHRINNAGFAFTYGFSTKKLK